MTIYRCLECKNKITERIYDFSIDVHGYPLCLRHQVWIEESDATDEAIFLYFALKAKAIPVKLEHSDGKKKIDIAIPGKLYIEVDGKHHFNPDQALTDFLISAHSWNDKIPTFRIQNAHIHDQHYFEIIVERVTVMYKGFGKIG